MSKALVNEYIEKQIAKRNVECIEAENLLKDIKAKKFDLIKLTEANKKRIKELQEQVKAQKSLPQPDNNLEQSDNDEIDSELDNSDVSMNVCSVAPNLNINYTIATNDNNETIQSQHSDRGNNGTVLNNISVRSRFDKSDGNRTTSSDVSFLPRNFTFDFNTWSTSDRNLRPRKTTLANNKTFTANTSLNPQNYEMDATLATVNDVSIQSQSFANNTTFHNATNAVNLTFTQADVTLMEQEMEYFVNSVNNETLQQAIEYQQLNTTWRVENDKTFDLTVSEAAASSNLFNVLDNGDFPFIETLLKMKREEQAMEIDPNPIVIDSNDDDTIRNEICDKIGTFHENVGWENKRIDIVKLFDLNKVGQDKKLFLAKCPECESKLLIWRKNLPSIEYEYNNILNYEDHVIKHHK